MSIGDVFISLENMQKSTLYYTIKDVGPVRVVNLGANPDLRAILTSLIGDAAKTAAGALPGGLPEVNSRRAM